MKKSVGDVEAQFLDLGWLRLRGTFRCRKSSGVMKSHPLSVVQAIYAHLLSDVWKARFPSVGNDPKYSLFQPQTPLPQRHAAYDQCKNRINGWNSANFLMNHFRERRLILMRA